MGSYADFLARKQRQVQPAGRAVDVADVHPMLHPWQRQIVAWDVRTGRGADWLDTGTGKTFIQLEYARLSGDRSLIVAPLAVCHQTVREAAKLGIDARYVRVRRRRGRPRRLGHQLRDGAALRPGRVSIPWCSMRRRSSSRRDGKTRTMLIKHFRDVKHRLACTATPAPNDNEELTSQAEFLGVMPRVGDAGRLLRPR